jgi:hypothetical protein
MTRLYYTSSYTLSYPSACPSNTHSQHRGATPPVTSLIPAPARPPTTPPAHHHPYDTSYDISYPYNENRMHYSVTDTHNATFYSTVIRFDQSFNTQLIMIKSNQLLIFSPMLHSFISYIVSNITILNKNVTERERDLQ